MSGNVAYMANAGQFSITAKHLGGYLTILDNNNVRLYAVATTAGKTVDYPAKSYVYQSTDAVDNWNNPCVQLAFQDNSVVNVFENPTDEVGTTVVLNQTKKLDF